MTQVSRFKLKPEVEERIFDLLSDSLIRFKNKKELNDFLDDFLSPIEKTVLAKRLAIAVLIAKGNDYLDIGRILKVTPTTIAKMSLHMKYGNGAVKKVAERIVSSDNAKIILQDLAGIFDVPIKGQPLSEYSKKVAERDRKIYRLQKEI
ncbi:MAG: hypothetical protein UU32_C0013G0007 [Candidatus Woesebacteria bacterium GW2011_GWB1_41_10]|uniref:TrpR like protein, YerC/YecD n=1 Tax=Candidatus Woesebacteria bacterium GW2011_GWB1_41_10 TaxID=1618577 RepID=A0A0G0UGN0_9BACT|nr:MAG: hypothetical protein UU32_C0013G0007 [Candidatus Woesebacteria bacterium GW2011_GWB1_41_10]